MTADYALIVPDCLLWQIAEKKTFNYSFLTEQHLQALWFEQKYFRNLMTKDGQSIQVLSPGIWNGEAGPDFLKAHLKIDGQDIKGDVELHLSDESWYRHQHHLDPRYNQVVLHIGFWESKFDRDLLTQNRNKIHCCHLEKSLTIPETRILQLIDLDLYPYKKFVGSGRCAKELFHRLKKEKIATFFKSAAAWRLIQKHRFLQSYHPDPSFQFRLGLARALGYKQNAEAFTQLFLAIEKYFEWNEEKLIAYCLNFFGFFSQTHQAKWKHSLMYQKLLQHSSDEIRPIPLTLHQIRPLNHPIRRLVLLSNFVRDQTFSSLYKILLTHWKKNWSQHGEQSSWKKFADELCKLIPSYPDTYWNSYYMFENKSQKKFLPLIGTGLKREILLNVFFPLLFDEIRKANSKAELETFQRFYSSIPALRTGKLKYLIHRYFGDTEKGHVLNHADTEQGAFQLHRDYCIHFEASCHGCSFIDNYHTYFEE